MKMDKRVGEIPASTQERGQYLRMIKEYARVGYLQKGLGTQEDFNNLWRIAFYADDEADAAGSLDEAPP